MEPRKPTRDEKRELLQLMVERKYRKPTDEDRQDEAETIEHTWIAVFDDYITDGPGYAGKVMVVIWGGSPSFTETYYWPRRTLAEDEPTLTKVTIEI